MKQKNIILIFVLLFLIISTCAFCVYKKPVLEAFNIQRCMSINNIASETASKAIIAGEIISSIAKHEKLLQIYTNSKCEPNEYNIDGTVKPNPHACKMQCQIPDKAGKEKCAASGKSCKEGVWRHHDTFPQQDKRKPQQTNKYGKSIPTRNPYYTDDEMCAMKGDDYPNKCNHECKKYGPDTCLLMSVNYDKCTPLDSFVIYKEDMLKIKDVGNEYLYFAYNVIPHLASHDMILKNILNTYSYYDVGKSKVNIKIENKGKFNEKPVITQNPTDRNYVKLANKFHNAIAGYTSGNCGSAEADESIENNDGYILWILVDWIRYQDHFIKNNISGFFSKHMYDAAAEAR